MIHIQKSENVYGNARVLGNARVSNNAQVSGGVWVYGDARVLGNARVYGDAQIFGNARVFGDAQIHAGKWEQSPFYAQGPKHSLTHCCPDRIHVGCECRTITDWKQNSARIGRANGYSDQEIEFYLKLISLL